MASASDNSDGSIRVMEEGLTCYICYNFLREPKDLNCPHVYCLKCLQEWTKKKPTIECPECRHITTVPQGGLINLKTNFRLKTMIEDYGKFGDKKKGVPLCPNHKGERQHFFCVTCGVTVCHNCLVFDHPKPQHEMKDLQVIVQSLKEKMDHVQKEIETIKKQKQELTEMERKLIKQHASLVDQMGKLYPGKCSPRVLSTYKPHTCQATMPTLDSLQIDPVFSKQKTTRLGHVGTNSKRTYNLKLLYEFGRFKLAAAVACTRTGQLAVVDLGKEVSIYQKDNVGYKHQYFLGSSQSNGNILNPHAVAVTLEGKFLVSDNGAVKVFSSAGRYERSWPTSAGTGRITTTPEDMIVIGSWSNNVITVHQSNGDLIRTHLADCKDFQDIASNGKHIAFTIWKGNKMCVIDFVTGQTLWTCDLLYPGGICFEQTSNTILVGYGSDERGHDVIAQYCSTTGRLISRLASGLISPYGMTVTHDSKLIVADERTVKMYQIAFE